MPHPFINSTNITTLVDLFGYANDVTGPGKIFGDSIVFILFVVLFAIFTSRREKLWDALMASSFVTFLFSVMFDIAGLIDQIALMIPLLFIVVGLVGSYLSEE